MNNTSAARRFLHMASLLAMAAALFASNVRLYIVMGERDAARESNHWERARDYERGMHVGQRELCAIVLREAPPLDKHTPWYLLRCYDVEAGWTFPDRSRPEMKRCDNALALTPAGCP